MDWLFLALAIAFELCGSVAVKMSEGFTRLIPSLAMFPAYAISFVLLTFAVRTIPISVAYAIWSAVGTATIALIGIFWFREPASALKFVCIGLIIIGVVGLRIADQVASRS